MKKIYLTALAGLLSAVSYGQCAGGRYSTDVFTNVSVSSGINYGSNTSFTGATTQLDLDVYEPTGDTETARPLIIWAHGGSFITGSKTDGDVVTLANAFARKGYVFVSINYRLGMWPINQPSATQAVVRAVQDMKASIRFFYQDRATTNTYKIDTTKIFVGGTSAGAITAIHLAYLDKQCELLEFLSASEITALGGIDGTSGNPGYSQDIVGTIGLAGALASYGWMEAGDVPICMTHGTSDGTVNYSRGMVNVSGINIMELDGSRMIDEQANALGVQSNFYTHLGAGHVPHASSAQYMDTTVNFIRDFLIDVMGCTDAALQPENAPFGTATLYALNYCGLSVNENGQKVIDAIYPNPSETELTVTFSETDSEKEVVLLDLSGRIIEKYSVSGASLIIKRRQLNSGTYILKTTVNGIMNTSKIVFK
tara:strand:+ start:6131 stop:7405 length:1275 start_codon:yes stop_codon:yes gene_type:complete